MNNIMKFSIILLLSMGVSGLNYANCDTNGDCGTGCNTSSDCGNDCGNDCSSDCDNCCPSTFFRPRSVTTNLTYRNAQTFYNRYHDARCNFFTWDSTFAFQKSRKGGHIGQGFFGGNNPLEVAQNEPTDFNSINLGLASTQDDGFRSTVRLCPERRVFSWLAQLNFNLDCFCTGLWADVSFAVLNVRHRLNLSETNEVASTLGFTDTTTPVIDALNARGVFFNSPSNGNSNGCSVDCSTDECDTGCHRTGVDDVLLRLGWDWNYCGNDHVGVYLAGLAPTGKSFDNSRWFNPLVGSKHGAVGAGLTGDYTIWNSECSDSDLVVMTELLYLFRFRHHENRVFDLTNGPLSRFLLVADASNPNAPEPFLATDFLTQCVKVEPRHQIEWWLAFHYQWCNFGFEGAYNLFWRDRERICGKNIDFGDLGIFSGACGAVTSNSNATIADVFPTTNQDATFTTLTTADVNFNSGAAQKAFSHTVTGTISYNNVWCDCYPWYLALGGGYEFANRNERCNTLENWHVFGKAALSF